FINMKISYYMKCFITISCHIIIRSALADTGLSVHAVELVSTFQLCCCTHELRLLSEVGGIEPRLALTLTYLAAVIHGLTFSGAIGNPSGALEHAYYARLSGCVCMSGLHARHKLLGYRCISPIHAPLPKAAAVELACAFAVQTAITHTRSVEEKYRVHAVTAAIATVVYAGMTALCSLYKLFTV
uniref:Aquaporin n=1 Tax=Sparus aurata TaxID=8175 RepID=A0A671UGL7_SPAAU